MTDMTFTLPLGDIRVVPRRNVEGDWCSTHVEGGRPVAAKMNKQSAVCGKGTDGNWLGLKPGEFDFVCPFCEGETVLPSGELLWRIVPTKPIEMTIGDAEFFVKRIRVGSPGWVITLSRYKEDS